MRSPAPGSCHGLRAHMSGHVSDAHPRREALFTLFAAHPNRDPARLGRRAPHHHWHTPSQGAASPSGSVRWQLLRAQAPKQVVR